MLMTPGPTAVPASVRDTMSRELINPDVDPAFHGIYNRLTDRLATVYGVDSDGDTGVIPRRRHATSSSPAARESWDSRPRSPRWSSPGPRCCVSRMASTATVSPTSSRTTAAATTLVSADYDDSLPLAELESVLADDDREFDLATTMVHCETPTGTLNDLGPRSTSSMRPTRRSSPSSTPSRSLGGVRVPTGRIDVCLGASQKCFSAPPGLTTAAISDRAWAAMEERDPHSLYTNFLPWRDTAEGSRTPTLRPRSWRSTRRSGCS